MTRVGEDRRPNLLFFGKHMADYVFAGSSNTPDIVGDLSNLEFLVRAEGT